MESKRRESKVTLEVTRIQPVHYCKQRYRKGDKIILFREEALQMQEMGWGIIVETTHKNRITK